MHKVTGIGGFFFRAKDHEALAAWYFENLGINPIPMAYGDASWRQDAGDTAFTAMPEAMAGYDPGVTWAINFRVADLDGIVEQLRAAGTVVEVDPTDYPNGRFASLTDPEGNPIQLWQPDA